MNRLRVFGITTAGLIAITIAVLNLWVCIAMEASTRRHAERDVRISLYRLRRLRHETFPAGTPGLWHHHARPSAS